MKTIIEMAREAELIVDANQSGFDSVESFVALVRADEREAILELVDSYAKNNTDLVEAIRARGQA